MDRAATIAVAMLRGCGIAFHSGNGKRIAPRLATQAARGIDNEEA